MVETLVRGSGEPVTVFAHGFGGGIADARPLGSGVDGTKVFYTARAHDGVAVDDFGYAALAADLRAVADSRGAGRAVGVSMGAGALCRVLADTPDRFARAVFFLPAVLDSPRGAPASGRLARLDAAASRGDVGEATAAILEGVPAELRETRAAQVFAATQAKTLCLPSMHGLPAVLSGQVALDDAGVLAEATCPALVLGCRGDDAHPASVAERLAAALPNATLHVYADPGVLWTRRADLRSRVSDFLNS
ncbi:MAG: alpha/beta fold hydrolase [Stackebrandtia sp.]